MKKNILTDEIDPEDIVRVKITNEPKTGWYVGYVGCEFDCVYDYNGNYMLVKDVEACKLGRSLTTRIIRPGDAQIIN